MLVGETLDRRPLVSSSLPLFLRNVPERLRQQQRGKQRPAGSGENPFHEIETPFFWELI
jgi:hypothetical protein